MIGMEILKPVVALAAWTMIMWLWMYARRIPAMNAAKVDPDAFADDPDAVRGAIPRKAQWPADNYNHLHEAPTVFYAVALVLAIIGQGDGLNATLAWVYVALRVVHSIWQATANRVMVRFALFTLSTLALMALVLHAMLALFHG